MTQHRIDFFVSHASMLATLYRAVVGTQRPSFTSYALYDCTAPCAGRRLLPAVVFSCCCGKSKYHTVVGIITLKGALFSKYHTHFSVIKLVRPTLYWYKMKYHLVFLQNHTRLWVE